MSNETAQPGADTEFIYDEVPYPALTFSQTHPDTLATMACFHGIDAADPANCRVLEVGCGSGANLLAMAYTLPNSSFEGVDLSAVHIAEAQASAKELGLSNAAFRQLDITDLDINELGKFDFIIAHGVYSWVPGFVRTAILKLYSTCLAENGVGFISYNTYPGCHIRELVWNPMRFHTEGIASWKEKVESGKMFIGAMANSTDPNSIFSALIKQELQRLADKPAAIVFHDDLEDTNTPFYFHQFTDDVRKSGLKYFAEADAKWLNLGGLSKDAQIFLKSMEFDPERREQYLDFIRCNRFRNTLVCRTDVPVTRGPNVERMKNFFVTAHTEPVKRVEDINTPDVMKFRVPQGPTLGVDHPLTKAAFIVLGNTWPDRLRFDELVKAALKIIDPLAAEALPDDIETVAGYLAEAFRSGIVKLHRYHPSFFNGISERPHINAFAAWQLRSGSNSLAILTDAVIQPKYDLISKLIPLLDGTHDRASLEQELRASVPELKENAEVNDKLPEIIESNLKAIAEAGLFAA